MPTITLPFARSAYRDALALSTAFAACDADTLGDLLEEVDEDVLRALIVLLVATLRAFTSERGIELPTALQALGVAAAEIAVESPDGDLSWTA
jgi:hypothetical protein